METSAAQTTGNPDAGDAAEHPEIGHNKPPRDYTYRMWRHVCPECAQSFMGHFNKVFCSKEHRRAWFNRETKDGAPLNVLGKAWRLGRHKKGSEIAKAAFLDLCNEWDRQNADDRKAGRVSALAIMEDRHKRRALSIRDVRNNSEFVKGKAK